MSQENRWFARRRSYFMTHLIAEFQASFGQFREVYAAFAATGTIHFLEIDNLVGSETRHGHLWKLKNLCHDMWQDNKDGAMPGPLFDWMAGSVFHEAMKLKENLYLCEKYGPFLRQPPEAAPENDSQPLQRAPGFRECHRLIEETSAEIAREMDVIAFLFGQANYLLRMILPDEVGNPLLLRLLVEEEWLSLDLWHEPLPALFQDLFPGQPEQGFCLAAQSYFEGHWFAKARAVYGRALAMNPDCHEARCRISQLAAIIHEEPVTVAGI